MVVRVPNDNASPGQQPVCALGGTCYGVNPAQIRARVNTFMKIMSFEVLKIENQGRRIRARKEFAKSGAKDKENANDGNTFENSKPADPHRAPGSVRAGSGASRFWLTSQIPRAVHLGGFGDKKKFLEVAKEKTS